MKLTVGRLRQIIRETVEEAAGSRSPGNQEFFTSMQDVPDYRRNTGGHEGTEGFYGDFLAAVRAGDHRKVEVLVVNMMAAGLPDEEIYWLLDRAGAELGWQWRTEEAWDEEIAGIINRTRREPGWWRGSHRPGRR